MQKFHQAMSAKLSERGALLLYVLLGAGILALLIPLYSAMEKQLLVNASMQKIEDDYQQMRQTLDGSYDCQTSFSPVPLSCWDVNPADGKPIYSLVDLKSADGAVSISRDPAAAQNVYGKYQLRGMCKIEREGQLLRLRLRVDMKCISTPNAPCKNPQTGNPASWVPIEEVTDCVYPWKTNNPVMPALVPPPGTAAR